MATRFYLPISGAAAVSPAFGSQWNTTTNATRLATATRKTNTALTAETGSSFAETVTSTGNLLHKQYVSAPLLGAQTIAGTFSAVVLGLESNAAADASLQVVLRVVSGDGATQRGVLYAGHAAALNTTVGALGQEFATTAATRIIPSGTALSSVAASTGDRLVIEVGHRYLNTSATSYNTALTLGDPQTVADQALTAALTTSLVPWVELSQNVAFSAATATLTDTFDTQDTAKWTGYGTDRSVVNGQLQINCTTAYPSMTSIGTHDLRGSYILMEMVQVPNISNGSTELIVTAAANLDSLAFIWGNGSLNFRTLIANVNNSTTVTYDPVAHRWWRLAESGGTVTWDTSPDGVTWTNRRTTAVSFPLATVNVTLETGWYTAGATNTGIAIFDNFNIAPAVATRFRRIGKRTY